MSATRDNHVWVQVRQMANYYVKLGGLKYLMSLDFELYDSYWLKDTSYFRPTWEKIAAEKEVEKAKKQAERELAELAEKNARGRQGKKYFSFPSEIKKEEDFSATSQPVAANPPAPAKKEEAKLVPEEKSALKKKFPNHRRRTSSLDDFISNYLKKEKEGNDA
ncbi:22405_t:CDS:2 [Racocetra persica]|uniref:22405_t:CDS:1 n=1 Tax=Racocetra persica TaxID=160502 RepID=A0ACA9QFM8_9GLOM|nr:22405_t:CDS:2 [Racocetra persica]